MVERSRKKPAPPGSVDAYLAARPTAERAVLTQVRAAIRGAVPAAAESISYGMPTYKLGDKAVVFFAAWKRHWSLHGVTAEVQAACAKALAGLDVEKDTVRVGYDADVPVALVARIATLRARAVTAVAKRR